MKMEKESESFYRELEAKTTNPGLKTILLLLADEEVKHFQALERMKAQESNVQITTADVMAEARATFKIMANEPAMHKFEKNEVDFYRKAASTEDIAATFYAEKAAETTDPAIKALLEHLADEERKHQALLEGIADFVTRPFTWLEDSEWNHLEDY
jgi:rubrerythrin